MMGNAAVVLVVLCTLVHFVLAEEMDCYGPGSIAGAVIGTLLATLALLAAVYFLYNCYVKTRREKHLVLETDPEQGDKYAFDNPCFKDAGGGLTPIGKALDKSGTKLLDTGKKWSQWSPLGALVSTKNEKKRTMDDSHLDSGEVKFVSLRGHDFTGLGFTICGNMRDGIFIKDVQHRGPAHDSGRLNPGDRIYSVRISFENMVYEDAVAILSSASPYLVEIEAKGSGKNAPGSGGQGQEMGHPVYRSRSSGDLLTIGKSARKGLFQSDHDPSTATDYSTHQVSSNNTTMERGRKSPQTDVNSLTKPERGKKMQSVKNLSPDQLKSQLEQNLAQKISHPGDIHVKQKIETEKQTSEIDNKKGFQKFGVRVLPMESKTENVQQRSPKSSELSQNDNNINQERQLEHSMPEGRDEVDKSKMNGEAPPVKRREKKNGDLPREIPIEPPKETENFVRQNSINGSGIKRDKAGIPQEIPEHMLQAAVAARKNRKSTEVIDKPSEEEAENVKTPKKQKGKAPAPPPGQTKTDTKLDEKAVNKLNFTDNLDEISTLEEKEPKKEKPALINQTDDEMKPETLAEKLDDSKEYCSDSDIETDNQSSVNTIELNSSDITIHHAEQESNDIKGRKTASTGDLSKIHKGRKSNTGTLERAQSLDITDSGIPTLTKKRKATKDDLDSKLSSDESLYEASNLKVKEPRLSLALDGLDTFQRNRLKKSSEWGNLEDVIMNLDKVEPEEISSSTDEKISFSDRSPTKFDFGMKDTTFGNTNLNDTNIELVEDEIKEEKEKVKNIIWPSEEVLEKMEKEIPVPKPQIVDKKDKITTEVSDISTVKVHNVLWPLSDAEKAKENIEQTSHSINIQTTPEKVANITDSSKREDNIPPKSVSKTDITETLNPPEKITQKPPLPEQSFSLKAQFQEKLNSKLNNDTPPPVSTKPQTENSIFHPGKSSQNFIFAEKYASNNDDHYLPSKLYDTNVSDDIKVSRHSLGSLERPKSDVLKSVNKLKMQNLISSDQGGVSNVTVTESKPSYENGFTVTENQETKSENTVFDMSTASELYTTAIDSTMKDETAETTNIEIKNITITETVTDTKYFTDSPSSLTIDTSSDGPDSIKSNTLTYVTEIQVSTPANNKNVSEIEINADSTHSNPPQSTSEPKSPEENLKKLPEMKFTTSSYETPKTPEKRLSHIELLRSNFEKSPPKPAKPTELSPSKSRIPVATKIEFKTSPERREDTEEKEIVEIMSSAIHSTPIVTNQRFGNPTKTPAKNVTVTSIRTSSKIPSGSHSFKPPVPVKPDHTELHENRNGSSESSFKQWVFNPSESSVTNIVVNNNKESHK